MPFDAGGTFTRSYNWQADRDAGVKILAQRMDGEFNNYAGGLNQTFLRTGIVPMGGPMNMNSNPIVGVKGGTLASPGFRFENDTDSGLMSTGAGNVTIVADGVAVLSAAANGVTFTGGLASGVVVNGDITASRFIIDNGYYLTLNVGSPLLNFDANDYISYDRALDRMNFAIAGTLRQSITGTGVDIAGAFGVTGSINVTGNITGPAHYFDSQYVLYIGGGSPIINFDNTDNMYYDRTANQLSTIIGGVQRMALNVNGLTVNQGLAVLGTATIQTPGNGGVALVGAGDNVHTGYVSFLAGNGTRLGFIGFVGTGAGPISYNHDNGQGHSFTGGPVSAVDIVATGVIKSVGAIYPGNDGNLWLGLNGAQPIFNFDASDYMSYDRPSNLLYVNIAGAGALIVNANGVYSKAANRDWELGYRDIPPRNLTAPYALTVDDRGRSVVARAGCTFINVHDLGIGAVVTIINVSGAAIQVNNGGNCVLYMDNASYSAPQVAGSTTLQHAKSARLLFLDGAAVIESGLGLSFNS